MSKEKYDKKIIIKKILISIFILIIAVLACWQCGTNPFNNTEPGTDSSVFIYIAKQMKEGQLPYKDIFDHKGPLLYLINYLGLLISDTNYFGIWLIEILFVFVYLVCIYKICKIFINKDWINILLIIINISALSILMDDGNFTEEYALPFIGISLYYIILYQVQSDKLPKCWSFIVGMCMGFVLLLRVNLVCLWIVYGIYIFIEMIIKKNTKELKKVAIYAIIGLFLVILPFFVALNINGIWSDFLNNYIVFNFKYITSVDNSLLTIISYFIMVNPIIILICIFGIIDIFCIIKKKSNFNINIFIASLINFIFTFIMVVMPKNLYLHYGIILLPTYIVPILININLLKKVKFEKYIIVLLVMVSAINILEWLYYILEYNPKEIEQEELCNYIETETTSQDTIIVLGNTCIIYLNTNRISSSKYIYQKTLILIDEEFKQELINDIYQNIPKLVIYPMYNNHGDDKFLEICDELVGSLKYEEVEATENSIVLRLK